MVDFSAALEEAYASAPADEYIIETLELIHAAFVDDDNMPDSIRVCFDGQQHMLKLEDSAPLHAGQTVLFEPLALEVTLPEQKEGTLGEMKLVFDGVPKEYLEKLDSAVGLRSSAKLIYREWVAIHDKETGTYLANGAPDFVLGEMTIKKIRAAQTAIEATATFVDLLNRGFPRRKFTREQFPGLFT